MKQIRPAYGGQSMVDPLRRVAVKRPEEAFRSARAIEEEWEGLGFTRPPHLEKACRHHRQFVSLLEAHGVEILYLPADTGSTLDSIYVHDPVLITDAGAIILRPGKRARRPEGPAMASSCANWAIPIFGTIRAPATAEAGDMIWVDPRTLLVGLSFRTNREGIRQLEALLHPLDIEVVPLHLPYADGPDTVLHLMSFISLLDTDLAVVYRPLLPVPLCQLLDDRGIELIDTPAEEYPTQGSNVLALAPREVCMVAGNPVTRRRLQGAGCTVALIEPDEICFPGAGGPTCLTRPLWRSPADTEAGEDLR